MKGRISAVGYSDFWDHAFKLNESFYTNQGRLHLDLIRALSHAESTPLAKTIRSISCMVATSYSALSILCLNGHGLDAMRIARSMFEGAVISAYLAKEPNELEPYLAFTNVSAKRLLDYTLIFPSSRKSFSDEQTLKINAEYASVRHLFPGKPEHVPTSWSRIQIAQMFERVGVGTWYTGFYHIASALVHMNARGMYMHFGLDNEEPAFHFPPSEDFLEQSIAAAKVAMHLVLSADARCTGSDENGALLQQVAAEVIK